MGARCSSLVELAVEGTAMSRGADRQVKLLVPATTWGSSQGEQLRSNSGIIKPEVSLGKEKKEPYTRLVPVNLQDISM